MLASAECKERKRTMKIKTEKTKDYFLLNTRVENIFINEYMVSAPGDYVKVFLFAIMYAELEVDFSNEDIAKQLSMDIEDVYKAWTYWEKTGAIKKTNISPEDSLKYDVEFVLLKQMLYGGRETLQTTEVESSLGAKMTNKEYKEMFARVERALGRVINVSEMNEIMSWPNDLGTSPEVIGFAFEFCSERKKKAVKYVEAVIKNWIADGFRTIEEVKEHVGELEGRAESYKRVFQALGFHRNPTEEEKRIMNAWFDKMSYDIQTILKACSKTAGISSPNINYVNRILENWFEEGGKPSKDKSEPTTSEITQYYEALRATETEEAENRRREVYEKVPRIKEIDNEERALSGNLSKIVVSNQIDKKEQIKITREKIDSLNMERAFLLTDNGFEMDYMDVKYQCADCKDTGMLTTGERCQCLKEITKEKIRQQQNKK